MEGLAGKRVAVTGAGGFIGQALCARLSAPRAPSSRVSTSMRAAGARCRDRGFLSPLRHHQCRRRRRCPGGRRAGRAHRPRSSRDWGPMEDFVRVNVRGTRNVLEAAARQRCERVVHVSSVATWGYEHSEQLDEDARPRPCGIPYIDTKGASDALALDRARGGEPIAVVRPGDVYGPGSTPWAVRPLEGLKQGRFMLIGRGQGRDDARLHRRPRRGDPARADDCPAPRAVATPSGTARRCPPRSSSATTRACWAVERIPRLPRPAAVAAAAAQELAADGHGASTDLHPQRDHLRLAPGAVLEPAGARAARMGATGGPRGGNAPHGAVVPAVGPALNQTCPVPQP